MDNIVKPIKLQELSHDSQSARNLLGSNLQLIKSLKVKLSVIVGKCEITVADLFALTEESVLKLDTLTNDPVEIILDGKVIARGELVVVDDNFGVRVSEIMHS